MYKRPFLHDKIFPSILFILFSLVLIGSAGNGCDTWIESDAQPNGIVNGEPTQYQSFKGVIGLSYPQPGMTYTICTGTLIDPQVVLSAGHCVYYPSDGLNALKDPTNLSIRGGANMELVYTTASEIIIHSKWDGDINNDNNSNVDLSIIKLQKPITDIEPYDISNSPIKTGIQGKIVGYGSASETDLYSAEIHRVGDAKVQRIRGARVFEVGNPSGTCLGDSGGPFFIKQGATNKWVLAGVTSYGAGGDTCNPNSGSWDVNVYTYRNWIDENMRRFVRRGLDTDSDSDIDSDTEDDFPKEGDSNKSPFGINEDNPVDCECKSTGAKRYTSLLNLFREVWHSF